MAGHSKFKNIMHRKGAQDAKRAKIFTKLIREVITAVRTGGGDINFNPRLRLAISNAKALNLPKDRIDNAIKKGMTPSTGDNYEEMRYEGYASGGIAIIIEALTDNRNRTASDVRSSLTKYGGNLGETGSVSFMFNRIGYILYDKKISTDENIFDFISEIGALDCESDDSFHKVTMLPEDFNEIREKLIIKYGDPIESKLSWEPQNFIEVDSLEQAEKLEKLFNMLEDSDDVQNIYTNHIFSKEIEEQISE